MSRKKSPKSKGGGAAPSSALPAAQQRAAAAAAAASSSAGQGRGRGAAGAKGAASAGALPSRPSLSSSGEFHDVAFKVMLVGDSGVGKTCLLVRFKDGAFLAGSFISTVGIDFRVSSHRRFHFGAGVAALETSVLLLAELEEAGYVPCWWPEKVLVGRTPRISSAFRAGNAVCLRLIPRDGRRGAEKVCLTPSETALSGMQDSLSGEKQPPLRSCALWRVGLDCRSLEAGDLPPPPSEAVLAVSAVEQPRRTETVLRSPCDG
ncbi:uncharacterized protein PHA67_004687 [Liasis olivaceus]